MQVNFNEELPKYGKNVQLVYGGGSCCDYAKAVFTYSLPNYQMAAGFYDILNHICEQYFSGEDDNTSDYLMEGLMKSLIHSSKIEVKNSKDYEARSNIMWTATWALNTLVAMENWMREIGVIMNISELGVTQEMLPGLVQSTLINAQNRKLTHHKLL